MNGFKFGWMKKTPSNLQGKSVLPVSTFEDDSLQSDDEKVASNGDWRVLLKNAKSKKSESSNEKFSRLYDEGASLAEEGRFVMQTPVYLKYHSKNCHKNITV